MPAGTRSCLLCLHFGEILPSGHCLLLSAASIGSEPDGEAQELATRVMLRIHMPCVRAAANAIWREGNKTNPPQNPRAEGLHKACSPGLLAPSLVFTTHSSQDTIPVFTLVLKLPMKLFSLSFTISFLSLPAATSTTAASQQKGLHDLCNSTHWERLNPFPLFPAQHRP